MHVYLITTFDVSFSIAMKKSSLFWYLVISVNAIHVIVGILTSSVEWVYFPFLLNARLFLLKINLNGSSYALIPLILQRSNVPTITWTSQQRWLKLSNKLKAVVEVYKMWFKIHLKGVQTTWSVPTTATWLFFKKTEVTSWPETISQSRLAKRCPSIRKSRPILKTYSFDRCR